MSEDLKNLMARMQEMAKEHPVQLVNTFSHPEPVPTEIIGIDPGQPGVCIVRLKPRTPSPEPTFDPNLKFGLRGFFDDQGKLNAATWNLINP